MIDQPEKKKSKVDWADVHRRIEMAGANLKQLSSGAQDKKAVLRQRAKILAHVSDPKEKPAATIDLVIFLLADEKYGVEAAYVQEVYPLTALTPLPCTPPFVIGITGIRGKIVSVIDIRKFFDLPQKGLNELDKIIVAKIDRMEAGIRADAILGIIRIDRDEIQPGLPTLTGIREKYLKGITPDRLVVLDICRLLNDPAIIVNEEVSA